MESDQYTLELTKYKISVFSIFKSYKYLKYVKGERNNQIGWTKRT